MWTLRRLLSMANRTELSRVWAVWRQVGQGSVQIEARRWRRALNAVRSLLRDPTPAGPIWAVSMVKNEADIIVETLRNLRSQGVDHILVADNGSTDGTRALLVAEGVHVVDDPIVDYWQAQKMSHLARTATRHGAAWVVPFDADEIWKGQGGRTLAATLRSTTRNVAEAEWWQYVPIKDGDGGFAERFPWRLKEPDAQSKQAFRANWLARLTTGNHTVYLPSPRVERNLRIAHFRSRSIEQMLRKARDGSEASRKAGIAAHKLPQWFEVTSEEEAARRLVAMKARELTHDPASAW